MNSVENCDLYWVGSFLDIVYRGIDAKEMTGHAGVQNAPVFEVDTSISTVCKMEFALSSAGLMLVSTLLKMYDETKIMSFVASVLLLSSPDHHMKRPFCMKLLVGMQYGITMA